MAMYLGNKKVAVTNTVEKQVPSMKAYFEAGGKCVYSTATSFEGCWQFDDTANVTDMFYMFYYCIYITTVPLFDTSNVTSMYNMFNSCYKLTEVPLFNTTKVTNMHSMFYKCNKLIKIPLFDTSRVTDMNGMFEQCNSLREVPQLDTSNVTDMNYMFIGCSNLETIHMININTSLYISISTKFTREALLEIIGNLKPQTSGTKTLTMGSTNLAKLTDEDKAIATNKGWTLA